MFPCPGKETEVLFFAEHYHKELPSVATDPAVCWRRDTSRGAAGMGVQCQGLLPDLLL